MDTNTQRDSTESLTPRVPPTGNQPNSTLLGKPTKIDPYFLIAHVSEVFRLFDRPKRAL